jgi:7-keto-8-aminopelargonate synthetase-like enzyme
VFAHNNTTDLEKKLAWAAGQREQSPERPIRILVAVESVYSMDGDWAPLREIVRLKELHGAWLMVDEAHATGLYGVNRRGLIEELGLSGRVEIQMGTLGKALGASGGFICGSRALVELLVNRARSFIFSTAPVPAAAAAARAAVALVRSAEGAERCQQLWERVEQLKVGLRGQGWEVPKDQSAIIPLVVGEEGQAVALADNLRERGILVPAIRYPTVARGRARLRITVSAGHTAAEGGRLVEALHR